MKKQKIITLILLLMLLSTTIQFKKQINRMYDNVTVLSIKNPAVKKITRILVKGENWQSSARLIDLIR